MISGIHYPRTNRCIEMDLIGFLLIGLIAGWIATNFMRGSGMGLAGNLVIGVVGAFVGGFLFRLIGFAAVGLIGKLITATVGAVVLLYVVQVLKKA
jgi:uncharacterized membrane protein YeaQ/YmgE (transglycosylase-associated protein family)